MPSDIVLFHSALGLRPGVHWFADRLRAAGHTVHTPDLYDGEVFDSLEGGLAKRDALGMEEVIRRGAAAAVQAPFYAGLRPQRRSRLAWTSRPCAGASSWRAPRRPQASPACPRCRQAR